MDRMRRFFVTSGILAVVVALTLGIWEARRRSLWKGVGLQQLLASEPPSEGAQPGTRFDPAALEVLCRDDGQFQKLLDRARGRVRAATERSQRLVHTETQFAQEIDKNGRTVAGERHVETIWTVDGVEFRQTVERVDTLKNKPKRNVDYRVRKSPPVQETFPLTKEGGDDGYHYRFDGLEQIDGCWTVRIAFEPLPERTGRFRGLIWLDAQDCEPRRFYGEFADKKPFLDQLSMLIEYGVAENGCVQATRSVIDGSGGFAMIQKRVRSEIQLHDYRPVETLSEAAPSRTAPR